MYKDPTIAEATSRISRISYELSILLSFLLTIKLTYPTCLIPSMKLIVYVQLCGVVNKIDNLIDNNMDRVFLA